MIPNMPYQQQQTRLQSGDWIIMFTDGISEAMNARSEEFTEKRIEDVIREMSGASAEEMKDRIITKVREFSKGVPQSDDITLIVIKVL
jgi:serine phosphatase RsbU (regulator of sigma subunit)